MVKQKIPQLGETTARSPVAITGHRFEVASLDPHLCLGFANTLGNRLTGHVVERLNSYGDLVAWEHEQGMLSEPEAEQLVQEAVRRPVEAASTLARAVEEAHPVDRFHLVENLREAVEAGRVPVTDG